MKDKALTVLREAWVALRWMLFVVCLGAYGGVWLVWIAGGLLLLASLGITAIIPDSGVFFTVATIVVMAVGVKSFSRDLRELLRLPSCFPSESTETFSVGEDVYEWDKSKRDEALQKHGVDFKDIGKVVWDLEQGTVGRHPLRDENGAYIGYEDRIRAFGRIDGKLHLVVYTMRGDNFRIISMRRVGEEELLPYKICQNCRWPEDGPDTVLAPGSPHDTVMNCGFPGSQKGRKIRLTDTCDNFEDFWEWWIRERGRRPPSGGTDYDEARIKAYYGEYE